MKDNLMLELQTTYDSVFDMTMEASLTEASIYDLRNGFEKLWRKIVEFFKKILSTIKNMIYGRVKYLNISYINNKNTHKIEMYSGLGKFYTLEFNKNQKVRLTNIQRVYNIMEALLSKIATITFNESGFGIADSSFNALDTDKKDEVEVAIDNIGVYDISKLYADIRGAVYKDIKANDSNFETAISKFINDINLYYMKCVKMIDKVGHKAIKNAKKVPGQLSFKLYLVAKDMSKVCLRAKSLITIVDE